MLQKYPRRLLSIKALMSYLVFFLIAANYIVKGVGYASDLDFVLSASGNSRLVAIWNFFASPVGNLVAIILSAIWLTLLVVWPAKEPSEESRDERPIKKADNGAGSAARSPTTPDADRLILLTGTEVVNFDLEPDSVPFVEFVLTVFNAHQDSISVADAVTGRAKYQSQPFEKEPYIVKNEAKSIHYGNHGVFVLRQGLTRQECEQIRKLGEADPNAASNTVLDITEVSVSVLRGDNAELCKLNLPDCLKLPPATPVKLISSSLLEALEQSASGVNAHAECERKIARLQDSEYTHYIRAESHENAFKTFKDKYAVPIAVADHQAPKIGEFVEVVRVCTHDPKLDDPMPTIKWEIKLKNRSVYRISLDGDVGPLFFEGHKLTEHKDLLENKVMGLYPERDGSIIFEQRLSTPEVNLLKGSPDGKFQFDKVMLYVKGSDAEHVTSHRVVIFSRFRSTLGRCSDEKSQAAEELAAEVDSLKAQLREIRLQLVAIKLEQEPKHGLGEAPPEST